MLELGRYECVLSACACARMRPRYTLKMEEKKSKSKLINEFDRRSEETDA